MLDILTKFQGKIRCKISGKIRSQLSEKAF